MPEFENQFVSDPALLSAARKTFRAFLESQGPHPTGYVENCLEYPPWVVYEFGDPPRRGVICGVSLGREGFTADLAVRHKYNQEPPLQFERVVRGVKLTSVKPVSVDADVIADWLN